jgi:multiple sugar transport system permease protein
MKFNMISVKHFFLGTPERHGFLFVCLIYIILLNIAYLYLNPLFYMISTMFKNNTDLLDPTVRWVPRTLEWNNLKVAFEGLRYWDSLLNSITIAGLGSLFHVVSCSLAGYAFAKYNFPLKNFLFFLLILSFLIPPQTILIPLFMLVKELGWLGTKFSILGQALFAQGIRGALYVIIFTQFFRTLPRELDEAARIDGAGPLKTLIRVIIPLSGPAVLVVFLFSFIFHWNETYLTSLMIGEGNTPLTLSLSNLHQVLTGLYESDLQRLLNETVRMAACFLIILPPMFVYSIAQRWFVEGIERTGLVE